MPSSRMSQDDIKLLSSAKVDSEAKPAGRGASLPSSWKENALLVSGLGLVLVAASMVVTTLFS